jgi:hypothetical protein
VVAGEALAAQVAPLCRQQGVWLLLDGQLLAPEEAPAF